MLSDKGHLMNREESELQLERIEKKLDALTIQQASLTASLAVRCPFESERIDDLARDLWGNGKLGIKMRIDRLEQINRVAWTVIAVIVTLAGILIGAAAGGYFNH